MTGRPPVPEGPAPVRVVFFGSGTFAVPTLERLQAMSGVAVVAVVTPPDRPAGRHRRLAPVPVAARATALGLPLLQPAGLRNPAARDAIAATHPDLAVLADYGRIVPSDVLAVPRLGFLNLHPSLLPRHRGATPIAGAILAGDDETGVTLFEMDDGLDTGPLVASVGWQLAGDETAETLEAIAAQRAADLLAMELPGWLAGARTATPQDDRDGTMTRPFRRDDGRLDPLHPASGLERRVRALAPWPGAFVETPTTRIAVIRAAVGEAQAGDEPGTLVADGDGLALATPHGRLRLLEVRPAGGRTMQGAELRRGHGGLVGSRVLRAIPEAAG